MKKAKKVLLVFSVILLMFTLTSCFSIKSELKKQVNSWADSHGVKINKYSYARHSDDFINKLYDDGAYDVFIVCDDFEDLSEEDKISLLQGWEDIHFKSSNGDVHSFAFYLVNIVSNDKTYVIDDTNETVSLDGKLLFSYKFVFKNSSTSSSSSNSSKTATCNYCGGSGTVNGDKCPWCNGSGKTYDNAFNDMLK